MNQSISKNDDNATIQHKVIINNKSSKCIYKPEEVAAKLDQHIVGQQKAKRAIAIALYERGNRSKLDPQLQKEITPKNILMIGPTGVGKTEIARRMAKLVQAPFIKVEATRYTEVGYVGKNVETIIEDLVENAIMQEKKSIEENNSQAADAYAESSILNEIAKFIDQSDTSDEGKIIQTSNKEHMLQNLRAGEFDDLKITVTVPTPIHPVNMEDSSVEVSFVNFSDLFGKQKQNQVKKIKVKHAFKHFIDEYIEKHTNKDEIISNALHNVQEHGIVFIDEIDKICDQAVKVGNSVSREGVQRDLLPIIEGTTVSTKHGKVKTDHILFVASGAFHIANPSDLLPEFQGRFPVKVHFNALTLQDFKNILTNTKFNLIEQYTGIFAASNVDVNFTEDAIHEIAKMAVEINENVENVGARRLHSLFEELFEDLKFYINKYENTAITVDQNFVSKHLSDFSVQPHDSMIL